MVRTLHYTARMVISEEECVALEFVMSTMPSDNVNAQIGKYKDERGVAPPKEKGSTLERDTESRKDTSRRFGQKLLVSSLS